MILENFFDATDKLETIYIVINGHFLIIMLLLLFSTLACNFESPQIKRRIMRHV